jgi:hypothetical protein
MLIRGVFDKVTSLGGSRWRFAGGRGALWDLNGSSGRKSFMSGREKGGLAVCAVPQRATRVSVEGGERGRGRWVSTRMRRRAFQPIDRI